MSYIVSQIMYVLKNNKKSHFSGGNYGKIKFFRKR